MEQDIADKLAVLEVKIDQVYKSSEKMRQYFLWTLIITIIVIILPIIGLVIILPQYMSVLTSAVGTGF
ncbi:MAG: hypothetical protein C3F02_03105 [Parcubacteria group bacterium]|nr:MAG: hypothetical protein C3F02_03105 [Parcubacteria group bacterium]